MYLFCFYIFIPLLDTASLGLSFLFCFAIRRLYIHQSARSTCTRQQQQQLQVMRRGDAFESRLQDARKPDYTYLAIALVIGVACCIYINLHIGSVYMKHYDDIERLDKFRVAYESQEECAQTRDYEFRKTCEGRKIYLRRAYWIETLHLTVKEEMTHVTFDILGVQNWFTIGSWGQVQFVKICEGAVDAWQAITGSVRLVIAGLAAWGLLTLITMLVGLLSTCHLCARRRDNIEEKRRNVEQHINRAWADPVQQIIQLPHKNTLDKLGYVMDTDMNMNMSGPRSRGFRLGGDGDAEDEQKTLPNVIPWMNA